MCIRCAYGVYVHTVCVCAYGVLTVCMCLRCVCVHTVCLRCVCAYGVCAYGVLTVLVVHRQAQECGSQTGTGSWLTDRYMAHYGVWICGTVQKYGIHWYSTCTRFQTKCNGIIWYGMRSMDTVECDMVCGLVWFGVRYSAVWCAV